MSKKFVAIVFVLAVIAAGIFVFVKKYKKPDAEVYKQNQQQDKIDEPKVSFGSDPEKLPEKFPESFPIEVGADILANYNAENSASIQATRKFDSSKKQSENYQIYQKYLNTNNWKVISKFENKELSFISAQKDGASLTIHITPSSKGSMVEASFLYQK